MSTHEPEKLLSLWATEQIDVNMATGYGLQNMVKLHKGQATTQIALRQLQGRVDALETKAQTQQTTIEKLQTLIDRLLVGTGIKTNNKEI